MNGMRSRGCVIDPGKIERKLGWRAAETFETGLAKTVRWNLSNRRWWQAILDRGYKGAGGTGAASGGCSANMTLGGRFSRGSSEWIDDHDAFDLATVGHVLGIQFGAAERAGGSDNGGIPIGQAVRCLDLQRADHDRHGDVLHLEAQPGANEPRGDIVRQRIGSRRAGRLH